MSIHFGCSIVLPLDKHGIVNNSANYRGIYLSPFISKHFELRLIDKINSYLSQTSSDCL